MKFYSGSAFRQNRKLRCAKQLVVMNLLTICLLGTCMQVFALGGHAQIVTLSQKNVPLQQVFREINRQTGLDFIYEMKMMKAARPVNIHVKNESVDKVLDICFNQQPFYYTRVGNSIILKEITAPKEAAYAEPPTAIPVKGKVTDSKGQPLEGATISVKGTNKAVKSDATGNFSIDAGRNSTLVISFVGFETIEVSIGSQTTITVQLIPSSAISDEVVVVGYGTEKKTSLTSAVADIKGEDLNKRSVANAQQSLQGLAPGVTVIDRGGYPGESDVMIRVRGITTLSGNDPLVMVDGIEQPLRDVNPNDIETIAVLKDAASTAIYGSRAANGVVLVTTKRAK